MVQRHLITSLSLLAFAVLTTAAAVRHERGTPPAPESVATAAGTHTVGLHEDGFSPVEIIIAVGDTVEFINENPRLKFFWPASDFHPTHEIYSEFDPGKPVPAGESWQFTFTRAGSWGYHDHLAPYFTGRITARAKTATAVAATCATEDSAKRSDCWNLLLSRALKNGGITEAFQTLIRLYRTEPAFIANGCHRQAHIIGEAAYAEYRQHHNWSRVGFGPETIFCNYGYYHGIFEHLFRDNPTDLGRIQELCAELAGQLSKTIPRIRANCFHGAGHGFMPDPPPRSTWGKPLEMLRPALRACEALTVRTPSETQECLQGAYNVMADWMNFKKYGLQMPENPLAFCQKQDTREHELACYYEYSMRIHDLASNDIVTIAERFVNGIADDTIAEMVMNSAASTVVESTLSRENYDDYVIACRSIPARLREPCLNGVLGGLVAHGDPGREHVKALQLCASPVLEAGERNFCYRNMFGKFRQVYRRDKIERLCAAIPISYRAVCAEP